MALHDLTPKLTYEDYILLPEDGQRHEIINGELFVTAAPFVRHQQLVVRLTVRLGGFIEANGLGNLLVAPTDVLLSEHDIVQPDLFFISRERSDIAGAKNIQGAPDLVIEILSQGTRRLDKVLKLKAYERCGVREYWILDPYRRGIQVWERTGTGFTTKPFLTADSGDVLTTALLPGLEIRLTDVFAD
jgi:Uma2 family endonuclease